MSNILQAFQISITQFFISLILLLMLFLIDSHMISFAYFEFTSFFIIHLSTIHLECLTDNIFPQEIFLPLHSIQVYLLNPLFFHSAFHNLKTLLIRVALNIDPHHKSLILCQLILVRSILFSLLFISLLSSLH